MPKGIKIISYYTYCVGWFGIFISLYILVYNYLGLLDDLFNWIILGEYLFLSFIGVIGATLLIDKNNLGRIMLIITNNYIILMGGLLLYLKLFFITHHFEQVNSTLTLGTSYWIMSAIISLIILVYLNTTNVKKAFQIKK